MNTSVKYNINPVPTDLQPLVAAIAVEFKARMAPVMHSSVTWDSMHVRRLDGVQPGFDVIPTTWPFVGTKVGTPMPAFSAVGIVIKGLELAYPYNSAARLPGIVEEDVSSGSIPAGPLLDAWNLAAGFWKYTVATGGFSAVPVLWTTRFAPLSNIIGSATADPLVTTQNTRKVGRGG